MVGLPFIGGSAPPALRTPVVEISIGSAGAEEWAQAVVSVAVEAGLAPGVDAAEVVVAASADAPSAVVGDTGAISLGYDDEGATLVFTGEVESVRSGILGATRIVATNGGATLSRLRVNRSYEKQKAGDVVGDLAGEAGVSTATVEDGIEFAFLVVDDRRSAYGHVADLARKSGFVAYMTPEGELTFGPLVSGQAVQSFAYGTDVLALEATEAAPVVAMVTSVGEGAAGSQGSDAWSWLVKDPASVTGSAGADAPEQLVSDASLRSADAARTAAAGLVSAAALRTAGGWLLAAGAPAVTVGSTIEIADAPDDALNGSYLVRSVRHRFLRGEGFTTLAGLRRSDGAGGLGALGGLL
jgi:phage protein D